MVRGWSQNRRDRRRRFYRGAIKAGYGSRVTVLLFPVSINETTHDLAVVCDIPARSQTGALGIASSCRLRELGQASLCTYVLGHLAGLGTLLVRVCCRSACSRDHSRRGYPLLRH